MTYLKVALFFILSTVSYGQVIQTIENKIDSIAIKKEYSSTDDFKITIYKADYSMAYGLQYILTNKNLEIIFKAGLKREKDASLFKAKINSQEVVGQLARIDLDSLKNSYVNPCVFDGSQILFILIKNGKSKKVYLSNYYQTDVGLAIELINKLVPKKYEIWYDKAELLGMQSNCK